MRRPLRAVFASALMIAWACWAASPAAAIDLPSGFQHSVVLSEVSEPTAISFAPDGRVFVAEKSGRILVFADLDDTSAAVFADLRTEVYDSGDRGLLGLQLDPEFPDRPYVYALYTYDHILGEAAPAPRWGLPDQAGDGCSEPKGADACLVSGRLSRLTAAGDVATGELVLLEDWCQQFSSHSVGDLHFAPDGSLYVSGGDGASFISPDYGQFGTPSNPCGDPVGEGGALRAQDVRTGADPTGLDGTVIRIDPDTGEGLPGNPMFGSLDANQRRIVAFGFRNPFRFAIAPEDGEVYVANVGWNEFEEIDRFDALPEQPYNSGWPCFEGVGVNPGYASLGLGLCESLTEGAGGATPPFFFYRHGAAVAPGDACRSDTGSASSGIAFYDGGSFPAGYDGALFFADPIRGCIFVMPPGEDGRPDPFATSAFATDAGLYPGIDIEIGPGGDLFYVKLFGDTEEGTIHRISYDPGAPQARLEASPEWGVADPLEVELDASGSTDPDGETLAFEWDLDDDGDFDPGPATRTEMRAGGGAMRIAVRVSDQSGKSSIARTVVYPGNSPPVPKILNPEPTQRWAVGEQIHFHGIADDSQEGDLPDEQLFWHVRLLHCPDGCHAHPLRAFPAVDEGGFAAPDHEYPARIEFVLTAVDYDGLSATTAMTIDPRTVDLSIVSDPPNLQLSAGHVTRTAPFTLRAIVGSNVTLSAPRTAVFAGRDYAWSRWSDGGERVHTVLAQQSGTYTATYATDQGGRPARLTRLTKASFVFRADLPGMLFRCRLDGGLFRPCRSPRTYRNLQPGRHTFRVFAVDGLGNADRTPVRFKWRVLAPNR